MDIKILYEDEYILALDKPSGLMVHEDGRTKENTLVDWINKNYSYLKEVGETQMLQNGKIIKRPGIVHRLDKDTSGVIVITKTKEAYQFLKTQFQNRKVEKIYNAVVWGNFSVDKIEGVINNPIGRSSNDFRKWSAEYGAKGNLRDASTEYKVLCQNSNFAFLELKPKTGRTHQIRVHLKSISHPVVCDKIYAPQKECGSEKCLNFNHLALHALSVSLQLPNKSFVKIESSLPDEFEKAKLFLSH